MQLSIWPFETFSLLIIFTVLIIGHANPISSNLYELNDPTFFSPPSEISLMDDSISLEPDLKYEVANTDCSSNVSLADIIDEKDMVKRNEKPSICRPRDHEIKQSGNTGTQTQQPPQKKDEGVSTSDSNPCPEDYPYYLSCGGPEIKYVPDRYELMGVENCVKGQQKVIEDRAIWYEENQLNEYCCKKFDNKGPSWDAEKCISHRRTFDFQRITGAEWVEYLIEKLNKIHENN